MTAILRLQLDDKDPVRVNSAINQLAEYSDRNTRTRLTANTTFYVSTSGSDSNSGSQVSPFLTIQHAYDVIVHTIDTAGFTTTINCATGTYTAGLNASTAWTGGGPIVLDLGGGTINSSGNCITVSAALPSSLQIQNGTLTSGGSCIAHSGTGIISLGASIKFGAASTAHLAVGGAGAKILIGSGYTITGGASFHYLAIQPGNTIQGTGFAVTITGTPTFSSFFAYATRIGCIDVESATFSGSTTGTRYAVDTNALIFTNGGGANYFPGTVAGGPPATGGQYL